MKTTLCDSTSKVSCNFLSGYARHSSFSDVTQEILLCLEYCSCLKAQYQHLAVEAQSYMKQGKKVNKKRMSSDTYLFRIQFALLKFRFIRRVPRKCSAKYTTAKLRRDFNNCAVMKQKCFLQPMQPFKNYTCS